METSTLVSATSPHFAAPASNAPTSALPAASTPQGQLRASAPMNHSMAATSGSNTPPTFYFSENAASSSSSSSSSTPTTGVQLPAVATASPRTPPATTLPLHQHNLMATMSATASPVSAVSSSLSSSCSSPLSSPSLLNSSAGSAPHSTPFFSSSLPTTAASLQQHPPVGSTNQPAGPAQLASSCLMSPYAARPHNPLPATRAPTSMAAGFSAGRPATSTPSLHHPQTSLSSSAGALPTHQPTAAQSSVAPASLPQAPSSAAAFTPTDVGAIKQLLEAIESERLRKKRLEWYLQEVISEKEELELAQQKAALKPFELGQPVTPIGGSSGNHAVRTNAQNVLDGVDNYMFTKKRRLSFVSPSGSLTEALQPPLKKQSISLDDASIAGFLSFQEDDLQALITAPSIPPQTAASSSSSASSTTASSSTAASSTTSSSSSSSSSSSAESITLVPPLLVNSTSLTPRRPSISFTPSGSLSLQSSNGSFSLSLPGGLPMMPSGSKGSLSSYSFSVDPMACVWAMSSSYPQAAETTPSQAGGGYQPSSASFSLMAGQLDPRISFDWNSNLNLWPNDDQLKETLTEFFDF